MIQFLFVLFWTLPLCFSQYLWFLDVITMIITNDHLCNSDKLLLSRCYNNDNN